MTRRACHRWKKTVCTAPNWNEARREIWASAIGEVTCIGSTRNCDCLPHSSSPIWTCHWCPNTTRKPALTAIIMPAETISWWGVWRMHTDINDCLSVEKPHSATPRSRMVWQVSIFFVGEPIVPIVLCSLADTMVPSSSASTGKPLAKTLQCRTKRAFSWDGHRKPSEMWSWKHMWMPCIFRGGSKGCRKVLKAMREWCKHSMLPTGSGTSWHVTASRRSRKTSRMRGTVRRTPCLTTTPIKVWNCNWTATSHRLFLCALLRQAPSSASALIPTKKALPLVRMSVGKTLRTNAALI